MGWVLMSERDVRRIEVLTEILSGRRTVASAAIVLAISVRQEIIANVALYLNLGFLLRGQFCCT